MRAVLHRSYGGPEGLQIADIPAPQPGPGEVLVRVRAASINAADHRILHADPFLVRLAAGLLRPRRWPVMGSDFAGVVEAVGAGVTVCKPGDAVMGDVSNRRGSHAELVVAPEHTISPLAEGASFVEAAAIPLAGVTALQALRLGARVQPGERVLVVGAGGGVGGFLVQLGGALGAQVTAVCGPRSVERVRAEGAHAVIDYTQEDFADDEVRYDVIFAVHGHRPLSLYKRCLRPGGRLVVVGGDARQIFAGLLLGWLVFLFSGKRVVPLTINEQEIKADLQILRDLQATGRLRVSVDRTFPLEQAIDAFRYVGQGHVAGKVVLTVGT
jgi:NADPH:quinone reductase-like Zn-dependent oxidoreductase